MTAIEGFCQQFRLLLKARFAAINVVTQEEARVIQALMPVAEELGYQVVAWSNATGFSSDGRPDPNTMKPVRALLQAHDLPSRSLLIMKDFHPYLDDSINRRLLKELITVFRSRQSTLLLISPVLSVPSELLHLITVLDLPLPDRGEVRQMIVTANNALGNGKEVLEAEMLQLVDAASGLSAMEIENVLALSLAQTGSFQANVVLQQKQQLIRKSGLLDYIGHTEPFSSIGGLDLLVDWLRQRKDGFSPKALEYGLPYPKGVLIIGVQGCGKSLAARAIAAEWCMPLLRLDVGRVFGSLVGSSEQNMRAAIQQAEALAPCVLWIDELDKGFSGVQSSGMSDGGTTARVFASFLTWMQEKTAPVFVAATANNVSQIPPEMLRKGRFDEVFFTDLPEKTERMKIFEVHINKRKRDAEKFDLERLAAASSGFSGAEIEQAVIGGLFKAFHAGEELEAKHIIKELHQTVPLSQTMKEQITALRQWSKGRARNASSRPRQKDQPVEPAV
ncbi:MAG: AAA family ATPase [Armatimonadota bacterium]